MTGILRRAAAECTGYEAAATAHGGLYAFASAVQAMHFCAAVTHGLAGAPWPPLDPETLDIDSVVRGPDGVMTSWTDALDLLVSGPQTPTSDPPPTKPDFPFTRAIAAAAAAPAHATAPSDGPIPAPPTPTSAAAAAEPLKPPFAMHMGLDTGAAALRYHPLQRRLGYAGAAPERAAALCLRGGITLSADAHAQFAQEAKGPLPGPVPDCAFHELGPLKVYSCAPAVHCWRAAMGKPGAGLTAAAVAAPPEPSRYPVPVSPGSTHLLQALLLPHSPRLHPGAVTFVVMQALGPAPAPPATALLSLIAVRAHDCGGLLTDVDGAGGGCVAAFEAVDAALRFCVGLATELAALHHLHPPDVAPLRLRFGCAAGPARVAAAAGGRPQYVGDALAHAAALCAAARGHGVWVRAADWDAAACDDNRIAGFAAQGCDCELEQAAVWLVHPLSLRSLPAQCLRVVDAHVPHTGPPAHQRPGVDLFVHVWWGTWKQGPGSLLTSPSDTPWASACVPVPAPVHVQRGERQTP